MNRLLLIEPSLSEAEITAGTTMTEQRAAASFAAHRRREYLGWRALVRRELGPVTIAYNEVGAPVIADREGVFIGVSHGAERVAVVFSDRPCAVDVERLGRSFCRSVSRYLSAEEQELSTDPHFPAAAWCAKEVLYKLAGERGLNLIADLHLMAVGDSWIEGRIKKGEALRLSFRYLDDAVVVWYL